MDFILLVRERYTFVFFAGGMASGVQVAISMSNTGGAWDNAKKYIERATPDSDLQGKGSDIHKVSSAGLNLLIAEYLVCGCTVPVAANSRLYDICTVNLMNDICMCSCFSVLFVGARGSARFAMAERIWVNPGGLSASPGLPKE